jgi:hypothetical protein
VSHAALDAEELDTLRSWRPTTTVLADEDALEAVCRAKNGAAAVTCTHTYIYLKTVCPHIYRIRRCILVCSHV